MPHDPNAAYKFPRPTEKDDWQVEVRAALDDKSLNWSHLKDSLWELFGLCPRCGHPMSNMVDTHVIVSVNTLDVIAYGQADAQAIDTEVVCTCGPDLHQKGSTGCGYGRGLVINIPVG